MSQQNRRFHGHNRSAVDYSIVCEIRDNHQHDYMVNVVFRSC